MVRCQECGYTNEPGTPVCKKCGSRVEGAADSGAAAAPQAPAKPSAGNPTMIGGAASGPAWDSGSQTPPPATPRVSNPTMRGAQSNMPAWDDSSPAYTPASQSAPTASNSGATASTGKCPACGFYPLRNEVSATNPCPNCGDKGSSAAAAAPSQPAPAAQPEASHQMQKASNANKTIRLGDLTPEEDKKPEFQLVDERSQASKDFSGAEVSVNRDTLDAGNMSISGQEHARFEFVDGKWYLSDHSSNGATFIQVNGKIELPEGTKILIGNRIYTFQSK